MEFTFHCPNCQRALVAEEQTCGSGVECPACRQMLTVPRPPQPVTPAPEQEEIVEVIEEYRPQQRMAPPVSRRQSAGPLLPTMPGSESRGSRGGVRLAVPAGSEEQWRRHNERPLRRQMHAILVTSVVAFCVLLAVVIYIVGRPPGPAPVRVASGKHAPPDLRGAKGQPQLTRLSREEQQELLELTLAAFRNLSPDEGQTASVIYGRLTQKQPTTEEQLQLFNRLFQKGVLKLPAERQQRLRQLFARTMPTAPPIP